MSKRKKNNRYIDYREILITLYYLLYHTDEEHPAYAKNICIYASKEYGLAYNTDNDSMEGNEIDRRRIGKCLDFLYNLSNNYQVPFEISQKGAKYYVESKYDLFDERIAKVLAALSNDRYTKEEDADLLIEKLLDIFSTSEYDKKRLRLEYEKRVRNVSKYSKDTSYKYKLVNKAYQEGKTILIRHKIYNSDKRDYDVIDIHYRVYKIKEYRNRPYAILIQRTESNVKLYNGVICEPIESLNIPSELKEREILIDDDPRDLNEEFRKHSSSNARFYGNIDKMIEANVIPEGGIAHVMSFYFDFNLLNIISRSFKDFFSVPLDETKCASFEIIEENRKVLNLPHKADKGLIIPNPLKEGEEAKYAVVNMSLNNRAFKSWLLSDPHGEGHVCIYDMVTVVNHSINESIAAYYQYHLTKTINHLSEASKERLLEVLSKNVSK